MSLSDVSRQLDNSLHPLNLSLDFSVEVLFLYLWEAQEVHRSRVARCGICWDVRSERLIDVFGQERRVR